jgi:hypothetical protein
MKFIEPIRRTKRRYSEDEKQTRRKPWKIGLLFERISEAYLRRGEAISVVHPTALLEKNLSDPTLPYSSPLSKGEPEISGDVPDLTLQISIDTYRPAFEGTFSSIYRGTYRNSKVSCLFLRYRTFLTG